MDVHRRVSYGRLTSTESAEKQRGRPEGGRPLKPLPKRCKSLILNHSADAWYEFKVRTDRIVEVYPRGYALTRIKLATDFAQKRGQIQVGFTVCCRAIRIG